MAASSSIADFALNLNNLTSGNSTMDLVSIAKTLSFNVSIKLDMNNYLHWKTSLLPAIRALDLERIISPLTPVPSPYIEVQSTLTPGTSTVQQQINPAAIIWKKADQLLFGWLISTVSPSLIGQVTRCKTSLELWFKLEHIYSQQSMARILQLRQQLQQIKKGEDSISEFVMKIKNIGDALMEAGEEVPDRDLILALMGGVGYEYDAVVVMMISSLHRTMSLEDAQFAFLMHEQRIDQLNTIAQLNISGASAHFATNQSGNYDKKGQRNGGNSS
ncbi:hypothetical protein ACOSQ2_022212 [Xanthoceras sorbifolium]